MQNEITQKTPLLNPDGSLNNPGWCRRNLFEYNRECISPSIMRLKEWDFYQISNGSKMVQINFFNISLASCATFGYVDLKTGEKFDCMGLVLNTPHKYRLNLNGDKANYFTFQKGNTKLTFDIKDNGGSLLFEGKCKGKRLKAEFFIEKLPEHESITIATPFDKQGHFFYTNKINCMKTKGVVKVGNRSIDFSDKDTFTVLDWGRGIWPYSNMWYWANGSAYIDGKPFGFELTWGFGNTEKATETALFYDGKCHKLGEVYLVDDPETNSNWMKPWHFKDKEGRLDLIMTPFYDNYSNMMPLNIFGMKTHQVHGLFNGTAMLDDGTVLEIKDMYAFCEKVCNKW